MFPSPSGVLEQLDESLDALDRLHAIVTTAVGEVDRSGLIGNARSTAAWFAQQTKVPAHHAKTTVRNARSLPKMPAVAAAFAATAFVDATLDPVGGSIFLNELNRLEHLLWEDDQKTKSSRTNQQRRADALVLMAERSAAAPADAKRTRVLIQVLVGYQTFNGRICELADGTVLTPGQVVSLLDDADVQRLVFESPSQVLDVGHRQRLFTGATRTAIQLAHLECQGDESCDARFDRCEIDHIEPYEWGGLTIQANGRPLCTWHRRRRQRSP